MFTIVGTAIGVIIAIMTIATNYMALSTLIGLNLLLAQLIIFAIYMSFGAFIGLVIDVIVGLLKK